MKIVFPGLLFFLTQATLALDDKDLETLLTSKVCQQCDLQNADLRGADLRHLDADRDLEFINLIGVQLEGARFKNGVRCAGFPEKGGWGCKAGH